MTLRPVASRPGGLTMTLLAASLVSACAPAHDPTPLDGLDAASREPVVLVERDGTVEAFRGRVPAPGASLEARARVFLDAHGDALGIGERRGDWSLFEIEDGTAAGEGRVEFGYLLEGVAVLDAGVSVHLSAPGEVFFVAFDLPRTDEVDAMVPTLSVADAEARARAHVGDPARAVRATELGLYADLVGGTGSTLAYRVRLAAGLGALPSVLVSASDGTILAEEDAVRHAMREVRSARRTSDIETATMGAFDVLATEAMPVSAEPLADEIFEHLGTVNDWFVERWAWDGATGTGTTPTIAYVLFGPAPVPGDPDPARRDPRLARDAGVLLDQMYFGDNTVSLSIVAHEYTHALVEHLVRLDGRHEAGALGEALADVFAALVTGTWAIVGRDGAIQRDLAAPSSISAPTDPSDGVALVPRPNHRSRTAGWLPTLDVVAERENDWGHVHHNSSIPANALFLATNGGTHPVSGAVVPGIGGRRMANILWHAVRWARISRTASFARAREALVATCLEVVRGPPGTPGLEMRVEHCGAIAHAFGAVGVGEVDPDLDTHVGSRDRCPGRFDFEQIDTDGDGTPDRCESAAPPDAGVPPVSPCPPTMPVSGRSWALDQADGPSTSAMGLTTLSCHYLGPANDAWFVLDWRGGDTEYHAACVATVPESALAMCSRVGRQARVVLYGTQDGVEDAAEERFARDTLVPIADARAGACPSPVPSGCAEMPIACPLALPPEVGRARLLLQACPTRSADGTFVQQICSYHAGSCGSSGGTVLSVVALVVDGTGASPPDADMCTGTPVVRNTLGATHYAPAAMASVSLNAFEAGVDLAALDAWAASLIASIEPRALPCP